MNISIRLKIFLIIFNIFCFSISQFDSSAQSFDLMPLAFQNLNVSDGLSQGSVICSFQDSQGFLWFGTQYGLNRYDGYNFKVYLNNPSDTSSITSNYIISIAEDNAGDLWIATSLGLNKYDRRRQLFQQFVNDSTNNSSISSNVISSIIVDDKGNPWIGTESGGLNYLNLDEKDSIGLEFVHFRHRYDNINSINSDIIRCLFKDSKGRIWIGTDRGLELLVDQNKGIFQQIIKMKNEDRILATNIWTINEDDLGRILIGTSTGLFSVEEQLDRSYLITEYFSPNLMRRIGSVISIGKDDSGNLWLGADGNGLYLWNKNDNLLTKIYDKDRSLELNDITIHSILFDRANVLWMGTKGGLLKRSDNNNFFDKYMHLSWDQKSLSDDIALSILEDNDKNIWVGTVTGIDIFNPELCEFKNITLVNDRGQILNDREIKSIYQDKDGVIWIGTVWDGLYKIPKQARNSIKYPATNYWIGTSSDRNIIRYTVFKIFEDRWENLWLATTDGIKIFNKSSEKVVSLESMVTGTIMPPEGFVFDIYSSPSDENVVWAGTETEGLFKFILGKNENEIFCVTKYQPLQFKEIKTSSVSVRTIFEDSNKRIWIGTLSSGLYLFNEDSTITNYTVLDGLSSNFITGILEDNLGYLWISTISGLCRFDTQSKEFMNFYASDGIQGDEFNGGAFVKSYTGDLYFGGTDGLTIVHPEKVKKNLITPQIIVTDIQLFNKSIFGEDFTIKKTRSIFLIGLDEVLNFSYDQNVLSFEFAALHYVNPSANRYAYMLEGVDTTWNYLSQPRKVTYAHLPPGTYLFRVKGSNNNNIWNQEGASVGFIISPPFWGTWWFRIIVLIIVSTVLVTFYRKKVNTIEQKKKNLEEQVREKSEAERRTREILSEVEILKAKLENENIYLKDEIKLVHNFENIISVSESFKKVLGRAEQVSSSDTTVLILGESGTGKELLARAIHNLSSRKNRSLIKVDCSTLPTNLIESELFGHEKGAFTGAINRKLGRFELADGGTIFLDEIGELSLEMQMKLLRILQDGEFERVGSAISKKVDVRIISATNRDLENAVQNGTFRKDLFYRLNVFPIKLPPLRERREDIPYLVNHFISRHSQKAGKKFITINPRIMEELIQYNWLGNIRELENVIERAVIVSTSGKLTLENSLKNTKSNGNNNGLKTLEELERQQIIKILETTDWRVSGERGAAKILGIKPTTLEYRMRKLGIVRK